MFAQRTALLTSCIALLTAGAGLVFVAEPAAACNSGPRVQPPDPTIPDPPDVDLPGQHCVGSGTIWGTVTISKDGRSFTFDLQVNGSVSSATGALTCADGQIQANCENYVGPMNWVGQGTLDGSDVTSTTVSIEDGCSEKLANCNPDPVVGTSVSGGGTCIGAQELLCGTLGGRPDP